MDGYETKKAAALALNGFMVKTGLDLLGTPYIVDSGGGLHCYWPFTQDIAVDEWKPVAENLKRLCKQQKLNIDMTVTADAARVLRIPDTFNFKKNDDGSWKYGEPKQVKLLAEGDRFDFDTISQAIAAKLTTIAPVSATSALGLPGKRPDAAPAVPATMAGAKLFENSTTKFGTIYLKTKKGTGCAQLNHFVENAEDDGMEPLWRGWLSIAQKCSDGDRAAVWLSELHPYDEVRMREKQAQIKKILQDFKAIEAALMASKEMVDSCCGASTTPRLPVGRPKASPKRAIPQAEHPSSHKYSFLSDLGVLFVLRHPSFPTLCAFQAPTFDLW
jgi:hypothetical protein